MLEEKVWSERERFWELKSLERSREIEQNKIRIALNEYMKLSNSRQL